MLSKSVNLSKDKRRNLLRFTSPPPTNFESVSLLYSFVVVLVVVFFSLFSLSFLTHTSLFNIVFTLTKMNEEQPPQLPIFFVAYNNFLYLLVSTFVTRSITYFWWIYMSTSPGPGIKSSIIIYNHLEVSRSTQPLHRHSSQASG